MKIILLSIRIQIFFLFIKISKEIMYSIYFSILLFHSFSNAHISQVLTRISNELQNFSQVFQNAFHHFNPVIQTCIMKDFLQQISFLVSKFLQSNRNFFSQPYEYLSIFFIAFTFRRFNGDHSIQVFDGVCICKYHCLLNY